MLYLIFCIYWCTLAYDQLLIQASSFIYIEGNITLHFILIARSIRFYLLWLYSLGTIWDCPLIIDRMIFIIDFDVSCSHWWVFGRISIRFKCQRGSHLNISKLIFNTSCYIPKNVQLEYAKLCGGVFYLESFRRGYGESKFCKLIH
jgi:hypothetical protein